MKTKFTAIVRHTALCALALLVATTFTACGGDDDDIVPTLPNLVMPGAGGTGGEGAVPAPQNFTGMLSTTVPEMPSFDAITDTNTAILTWDNADMTSASITLGAFSITAATPMGTMSYEIGAMTISGITCAKEGEKVNLTHKSFECQAGNYATTGTLVGALEDGVLRFTIVYRPGSMPFDVQSVFVGALAE